VSAPTVGAGQSVPAPRADDTEDDVHRDLGAFALGVLEDDQSIRFAAHLAECDRCANELDGMLTTREALAEIDATHLATTEAVLRDGHLWERLREDAPAGDAPAQDAEPATTVRVAFLSALAAGAVLLIAALVVAIVVLG
jgi:hypothetical protein